MKLSVIIPTYNRKDKLSKTLIALSDQEFKDFEVIIVDDGSKDGTDDLIRTIDLPFSFKYLSQQNKGPATARNLGIRNASGELIFFTGDDITPSKNLLEELIKSYVKVNNDKVAVLGYTQWAPQIKMTPFRHYVSNYHFAYPTISDDNNVDWGMFYTSNILINKEFLLDVGLFDEDFPFAAYEDTELSYRLYRRGLKIIFNKNAVAYHDHEISFKDYQKTMINRGKAAVILTDKVPILSRKASYNETNNLIKLFFKKLILNQATLLVLVPIVCLLDNLSVPLPRFFYTKIMDHYRVLGVKYQLNNK